MRPVLDSWKTASQRLQREIQALSIAYRDPRTPLRAKVLAVGIVAYALSPIDLIPDVIPVLGYLDDLILLPLAIWLVLRMIPQSVMADARLQAASQTSSSATDWRGAAIVVALWVVAALLVLHFVRRFTGW